MDEFTFFWGMIHECLEYVGKFAPLIVLAVFLAGLVLFCEKNSEKDK